MSATHGLQMLKVGEGDVPGPELFWMAEWDAWHRLDFQVGVVRSDDVCGLINTGPADDLTAMNNLWTKVLGERGRMRRRSEWAILAQFERIGVALDEVTHIVLTPLQLYTVSNVPLFPNAEICLSRRGWIHYHTTHSHPHDVRWNCIPPDLLVYLTVDAWDRVRLLDDEDEIVPGLRTWWAGGHHRATLAIEVDTPAGVAVVSDAFFLYRNVEQDHPIGICENMYEALAAYQRARSVAAHLVPLYDPLVFERYPDGVVAEPPTTR
jgi:hypothetical protein